MLSYETYISFLDLIVSIVVFLLIIVSATNKKVDAKIASVLILILLLRISITTSIEPLISNFIESEGLIDSLGKYDFVYAQIVYIIQTICFIVGFVFVTKIGILIFKKEFIGNGIVKNIDLIVTLLTTLYLIQILTGFIIALLKSGFTESKFSLGFEISQTILIVAALLMIVSYVIKQIQKVYEENQLTI